MQKNLQIIINTVFQLEFGNLISNKTKERINILNLDNYPEILDNLKKEIKKANISSKQLYEEIFNYTKNLSIKNLDIHLANLKKFCLTKLKN